LLERSRARDRNGCVSEGTRSPPFAGAHRSLVSRLASLAAAHFLARSQAYGIKNYNGPLKAGVGGDSYASDERYGARSVLGANITMPNGNMDPWHSLGVVNSTGTFYDEDQVTTNSETVVFIDGTAHWYTPIPQPESRQLNH
jgi:hypothetical protein